MTNWVEFGLVLLAQTGVFIGACRLTRELMPPVVDFVRHVQYCHTCRRNIPGELFGRHIDYHSRLPRPVVKIDGYCLAVWETKVSRAAQLFSGPTD